MNDNRQPFEEWLRKKKRSNGEDYSEETISNYVTSLKGHLNKLDNLSLENTNLFTINDLSELKNAVKEIKNNPGYAALNDKYHRIVSSALSMYEKFLTENGQQHVNNKDAFTAWLKVYPNHKYNDSTIKRYIRALEKAEEWLGVSLPYTVLESNNLEDFLEIERLITTNPDYENVNWSHGHGDLSAALRLYKLFIQDDPTIKESDSWYPSLSAYSPGISKEQWVDILNDPDCIGPIWGGVLAMFFKHKDGATCKYLGQLYDRQPFGISGNCTQLAMRISKITQCPLFINEEGKTKYWPVLFVGKKPDEGMPGNWMWKLRDELYEACKEVNIIRFLNTAVEEREMDVSVKEAVDRIRRYIAYKGFSYNSGLIENFYLSLKSKPFVILAGTSGTGKTRLVKLFSEAIGAEYKMVPVRPDWSDSSDLFGHVNLNGEFVPGDILEFIREAVNNPDCPYILCLDEMNLARVEYYLSDILSVIETRDWNDEVIITDDLITVNRYGNDKKALSHYGSMGIPENLYIVGTVNMDETTFPFSKKVLDRANTIEFNYVDLNPDLEVVEECDALKLPNSFLKTEYLHYADCDDKEYARGISEQLQALNAILQKANAHVGYRVRDEIVFYMLNNKNSELLSEDEAFDNEVMQKILPRIQGSSVSVKRMLCELFAVFAGDSERYDDADAMLQRIDSGVRYPNSAKKTAFMVRRFEEDGFTSYWL